MATETASTGRESDKFMLRLPEGMRATIKEEAEKNGRTMNAEIVARLAASFESPRPSLDRDGAGDQFDRVRAAALERLEVTAQEISDRVAALIAEKMKTSEK